MIKREVSCMLPGLVDSVGKWRKMEDYGRKCREMSKKVKRK